jgi:antitoxin ParD1/3/4
MGRLQEPAMANVEKLSIALSSDMVQSIRDAVDSGDYATTSEVVRDALRLWRFKRISVDPSDTETIRRLVAEALDSPSVDAEPVFARLEAKYAAMAAAKRRKQGAKRETAKTVAKRRSGSR